MSNQRFRWEDESPESCVFELRNRNHVAKLTKDSGLKCLVPGCGHTCDEKDLVYKPNPAPNTKTNKIMAHKECVDKFAADLKSAGKQAAVKAQAKKQEQKGIIVVPGKLDVLSQLKKIQEKARQQAYQEGFEAGKQAALIELAAAMGVDESELGH